jgi:hypothetical protein
MMSTSSLNWTELGIDPIDVLTKTKNTIQEYGWLQNRLYDDKTHAMCIRGALMYALSGHSITEWYDHWNPGTIGDYNTIEAELSGFSEWPNGNAVVTWNNRIGRTKEEVIALLDQRIEHFKKAA